MVGGSTFFHSIDFLAPKVCAAPFGFPTVDEVLPGFAAREGAMFIGSLGSLKYTQYLERKDHIYSNPVRNERNGSICRDLT